MIAVLGWCDYFGNDTSNDGTYYVDGIYPNIEEARKHFKEDLRWVEFEWGEVDFVYNETNPCT